MTSQVLPDYLKNSALEENLEKKVASILASEPSTMVRTLAKDLNLPEGDIVKALPPEMRLFIPGNEFITVWEIMTTWEKVTFMAETPGAILEIPCALPKGKMGHSMYNLSGKNLPLGGHILVESIAAIWLISKPIFGKESHSVQFFTETGQQCFAVYLGRGEDRTIMASVKQGYLDLWNKYTKGDL